MKLVIDLFFEVYRNLGPGLLEHVYASALERELRDRGIRLGREVSVVLYYKGLELARQRLDMLVEDCLIIEIKATPTLHESAVRQMMTYLMATGLRRGLVLHFGPRPRFERVRRRWSSNREERRDP